LDVFTLKNHIAQTSRMLIAGANSFCVRIGLLNNIGSYDSTGWPKK